MRVSTHPVIYTYCSMCLVHVLNRIFTFSQRFLDNVAQSSFSQKVWTILYAEIVDVYIAIFPLFPSKVCRYKYQFLSSNYTQDGYMTMSTVIDQNG